MRRPHGEGSGMLLPSCNPLLSRSVLIHLGDLLLFGNWTHISVRMSWDTAVGPCLPITMKDLSRMMVDMTLHPSKSCVNFYVFLSLYQNHAVRRFWEMFQLIQVDSTIHPKPGTLVTKKEKIWRGTIWGWKQNCVLS